MKNKFFKLIILFSTLTTPIFAQQNFAKADAHALKVGKLDSTNMGTIATILTKPFAEKIDKARAIYTWIATNITYDVKAASKEQTDKNTTAEVLLYRKAVGIGFATLFQDMCSSAGIRCLTADGHIKRNTEEIGDNELEKNHSWAVVQLGLSPDTWHYVDVALASGSVDEEMKVFTKKFSGNYFFADKAIFNWQHFPDNPAWKLDVGPKNKKEFLALPIIRATAYDWQLKKFTPELATQKAKLSTAVNFSFVFGKADAITKVTIQYGNGKKKKIKNALYNQSGNTLTFSYKFDVEDNYPVTISINDAELITYKFEVVE
jgi:transglutaminase/protease-like cytokinesis protein 3